MKAAELLIAAADGTGDIDAATRQIEVALFLEAQLGPSKIPDNLDAVDYASQLVALSRLRLMLVHKTQWVVVHSWTLEDDSKMTATLSHGENRTTVVWPCSQRRVSFPE